MNETLYVETLKKVLDELLKIYSRALAFGMEDGVLNDAVLDYLYVEMIEFRDIEIDDQGVFSFRKVFKVGDQNVSVKFRHYNYELEIVLPRFDSATLHATWISVLMAQLRAVFEKRKNLLGRSK